MANLEKIEETLRYIEELPNGSNLSMSTWGYTDYCGTTACLAGWRYFMDHGRLSTSVTRMSDYTQRELGLTRAEANQIFFHSIDCETVEDLRIRIKDVLAGNY